VIKARNRKLALVLVLAMLMTMFAGLGTASAAAVDYSAFAVPTVKTENDFNKTLGSILVEIDKIQYLNNTENWVTLKLPSGVKIDMGATNNQNARLVPNLGDIRAEDPVNVSAYVYVKNATTVDIKVVPSPAADSTDEGSFVIKFEHIKVQSGSGNLDVTFIPQSGSALPGGTVTIANIVSKGATQAAVSSVKNLGAGQGAIDTISIAELSPGVFLNPYSSSDPRYSTYFPVTIEIELPDGVTWANAGTVRGSWAFPLIIPTSLVETKIDDNDDSVLIVEIKNELDGNGKAGRLDISGLEIIIDEDDAKKGDIKAKISSDKIDGVTKQDLVIAKYGDYDVTLAENEVTQIIAGHDDQEIGSFYIEEALADSLIGGRTLVFELPAGVKWNEAPELTLEKGSIDYDSDFDVTASKVRIKINKVDTVGDEPAKILVEEGKVYVEPNFEGDVVLEVSGTAGVKGEVKVAEAIKAVEISVSEVPNIIIGEQNVKAGDIIIKENAAEAIQEGDIVIELAGGYVFYKEPTVEVTEGDLRIDDVDINNDDQLVITIDKESNDPSTITISDIYITGYRYAPTGPVVAKFVAAKGNAYKDEFTGSTALDVLYIAPDKDDASRDANDVKRDTKYSEKSVGEVIIANCITPAEAAATIQFKIGSNIYYVGGVAKVMDVAPYIKGDRTYVPMRYLGEVLGAEVVWDDAARTVTLTKGDTTVVFTIGSTTYTVNGESKTADVAPEIASDRAMLPARFVAEAFGAVVGWDAAAQTVVVQVAQ